MVRAKFYVHSKTEFSNNGGVKVELLPVYSNDPENENKLFWEATPSGSLEMYIKADVAQMFEIDKEYYLDFTAAE